MNKRIWAAVLAMALLLTCGSAFGETTDGFGAGTKTMSVTYTLTSTSYEENLYKYKLSFPPMVILTRDGDNANTASGSYEFGLIDIQPGKSATPSALTCPFVDFRVTPITSITNGTENISVSIKKDGSTTVTGPFDIKYVADNFYNTKTGYKAANEAEGTAENLGKLVTEFKITATWDADASFEYGDVFTNNITYYGRLVQ